MKKEKQVNDIYYKHLTIKNLGNMYNIVRKTCKNRSGVFKFSLNKNINLASIYEKLYTKTYRPSKYTIFIIFEPKPRLVMSQTIEDKIVNHFIANYYLLPYLENKLIDSNVATRKKKGSSYAYYLLEKYIHNIILKNKNTEIYCLKLDISKYFYNISHDKVLDKIKVFIKDKDVLNLIELCISETNKDYINKTVDFYNRKYNTSIPYYRKGYGLSIGAMTSQFLAIFYLNEIDHFIKEELKCKYYIRYMDDILILDIDKDKLKDIWKVLDNKFNKVDLELNKKSNLYRISNGISFLGYTYKVCNNKLVIGYNKKTYNRIKIKLNNLYLDNIDKYCSSLASLKGYLKYEECYYKMKLEEKYQKYLEKYPEHIIIIKNGLFYSCYFDSAKIVWFFFEYKWHKDSISFGNSPYDKVLKTLRDNFISYVVIDNEKIDFASYDDKNRYASYLELANIKYDNYKRKEQIIDVFNDKVNRDNSNYDKILGFLESL